MWCTNINVCLSSMLCIAIVLNFKLVFVEQTLLWGLIFIKQKGLFEGGHFQNFET